MLARIRAIGGIPFTQATTTGWGRTTSRILVKRCGPCVAELLAANSGITEFGTGLRLAEIVGLNVGDPFFPDGRPRTRVRIRAEIAKGLQELGPGATDARAAGRTVDRGAPRRYMLGG